jgi:hypothetical protein
MDSSKKILKLKCFSSLKILTSTFYLQRLLELFFFLSFFNTFCLSLFFNAPSFLGLGVLMINEEKKHSLNFSFKIKLNGMAKP